MQKVKFVENVVLRDENEKPKFGYREGEVAELADDVAQHWLRRGKAVPYDGAAEAADLLGPVLPATLDEVIAACALVDPTDEGQWTGHGMPRVEALETLLENRKVDANTRDLAWVKFTEGKAKAK